MLLQQGGPSPPAEPHSWLKPRRLPDSWELVGCAGPAPRLLLPSPLGRMLPLYAYRPPAFLSKSPVWGQGCSLTGVPPQECGQCLCGAPRPAGLQRTFTAWLTCGVFQRPAGKPLAHSEEHTS